MRKGRKGSLREEGIKVFLSTGTERSLRLDNAICGEPKRLVGKKRKGRWPAP